MAPKGPHILLITGNSQKLLQNIAHIVDDAAKTAIEMEIRRNTVRLFRLGEEHFDFGKTRAGLAWRQAVSRFYYGAYNAWRALQYATTGAWSDESDEHKKFARSGIPAGFPNANRYELKLPKLRDDRNIADYDHDATEADLLVPRAEAESLVADFLHDCRNHLRTKGIPV